MNHPLRACPLSLSLSCLLLIAACARQPDGAPIATTTATGQSVAPSADAAERAGDALVRFVHAVPASGDMDVYAGDVRVFDRTTYRATTAYQQIDGERYIFAVRPAGRVDGDALASMGYGLEAGHFYTVVAMPGERDTATLRVVEDDISAPTTGKARLRIVHAARAVEKVDLYRRGQDDPVFRDVEFQSVSDYEEIDPWTGGLEVRGGVDRATVLAVATPIDAGRIYTVVVTGAGGGTPGVETLVIQDQRGAPPVTGTH